MSNGARHVIGVITGLVATPVLVAGLVFGVDRMLRHEERATGATFGDNVTGDGVLGILVFAAVAAVIGMLVASRISPLAALVPGIVYTAYGVLWTVGEFWVDKHSDWMGKDIQQPFWFMSGYQIPLVVGLILVAASIPPSRWRVPRTAPIEGPAAWQPPAPAPEAGGTGPAWQPQAPGPDVQGDSPAWRPAAPEPGPEVQGGRSAWQPPPRGGWQPPPSEGETRPLRPGGWPPPGSAEPESRQPRQGGWPPPPPG